MDQQHAVTAPCADYLFVGARGSGESPTAEDGMGRIVRTIRDGVVYAIPSGVTVKQVALAYPAYAIEDPGDGHASLVGDMNLVKDRLLLGMPIDQPLYFFGVQLGAHSLIELLQTEKERCPNEQPILAGYSQGAWVVHIVLGFMGADADPAAVVLVADPARNAGTEYPSRDMVGAPTAGLGVGAALAPLVPTEFFPLASTATIPQSIRRVTIELCGTDDPVCDAVDSPGLQVNTLPAFLVRLKTKMPVHSAYGTSVGVVDRQGLIQIGQRVASMLGVVRGVAGLQWTSVRGPTGTKMSEVSNLMTHGDSLFYTAYPVSGQDNQLYRITGEATPVPIPGARSIAYGAWLGDTYFYLGYISYPTMGLFRTTASGPAVQLNSTMAGAGKFYTIGNSIMFVRSGVLYRLSANGSYSAVGGAGDLVSDGSEFVADGQLYFSTRSGTSQYPLGLYRVGDTGLPASQVGTSSVFAFGNPIMYQGALFFTGPTVNGSATQLTRLEAGAIRRYDGWNYPSKAVVYDGALWFTALETSSTPSRWLLKIDGDNEPTRIMKWQSTATMLVAGGDLLVQGSPTGSDQVLLRFRGSAAPVSVPVRALPGTDVPTPIATLDGTVIYKAYTPTPSGVPIRPMHLFAGVGDSPVGEISALWTPQTPYVYPELDQLESTIEYQGRLYVSGSINYSGRWDELWVVKKSPVVFTLNDGASAWIDHSWFQPEGYAYTRSAMPSDLEIKVAGQVRHVYGGFQWTAMPAFEGIAPGKYTVEYTLTDAGGNVTRATQSLTVAVPMSAPQPQIYGEETVGGFLRIAKYQLDAGWTPAPIRLSYQWLRNGAPIPGATDVAYQIANADLGARISVRVTGSKAGYPDKSVTSAQTYFIKQGPLTGGGAVSIVGGAPVVGQPVSAVASVPHAGWQVAYQWRRDGVAIPGATQSRYVPVGADTGSRLSVYAVFTNFSYVDEIRGSSPTSAVRGVFITPATVSVTGRITSGSRLTARVTASIPNGTYQYQWLRNGAPIVGQTASSYVLRVTDRGAKISVRVTANRQGYLPATSTSAVIAVPR